MGNLLLGNIEICREHIVYVVEISANKHQNNTQVSAWTFRHDTFIYYSISYTAW